MKNVLAITADRNSGKTSAALGLIKMIPGLKGFISLSEGNKDEITLLDVENGNRLPLMSRHFSFPTRVGAYSYLESTFSYANEKVFNDDDVIIIDEIGRLECEDKGFDALMRRSLSSSSILIITVRNQFIEMVENHYGIKIIPCSPDKIIEKASTLLRAEAPYA